MDVEAWLQSLGLESYVPAFRDNEIDWEVLPKLTSDDSGRLALQRSATGGSCWMPSPPWALLRPWSIRWDRRPKRPKHSHRGATRSGGSSRSCSMTSSPQRRCRCGSIPRICAGSSAPTIAQSQRLSRALAGLSPATWATASWFISDIRRRTRTTPSGRCAPGWGGRCCRSPRCRVR